MKKSMMSILFVLASFSMSAQVGINTTVPEASAALDIQSNSKGFLAPRMTTSQRLAIEDPANGLLVYDTSAGSFYFFNGTSWGALESADASGATRNNYKLVKSAADLSEELTAGGGAEYLLNENYFYEINGTIVFDNPINLNGAYIAGVDTSEDVLVNNSSGALFQSSGGGSLRNVLISGNGKQVFDLSGSGSNLVVNNTIFSGASSMGDLSGMNVVFFNICQFVNNSDGFNATNITSLLFDNIFWNTSNAGTFLDMSGSFDDVQLANGRIVADSGETGLNVSTNPTINISASMNGINFAGAGTRVNGYTISSYPGYLFTDRWDVDCPGITVETDDNATGDINLSANVGAGHQTTFTDTGTGGRTKLLGASTSNNLFRFQADGNNRIVYKGKRTRYFKVSSSISFQSSANNTVYIFYLAKGNVAGGTPQILEETKVYRQSGGTGDIGALALVGTVELETDEYLEVWVERYSGSGSVLTVSLNLVAN